MFLTFSHPIKNPVINPYELNSYPSTAKGIVTYTKYKYGHQAVRKSSQKSHRVFAFSPAVLHEFNFSGNSGILSCSDRS